MKNILEMLETSALNYPEKYIFIDNNSNITYSDFIIKAKAIAGVIIKKGIVNSPVAVLFERSVENLVAMAAVLYSGNYYAVIDSDMPCDRIKSIFDTLNPRLLVASEKCMDKVNEINFDNEIIYYNESVTHKTDEQELARVRSLMVDTNPAYVLFTSGSTGVPKGTVVNHRSVIAYTEWFAKTFNINEDTVFGSQTPFYFSMSVSDVFATMRCGATLNIMGKELFSFPMKLIEFLNERKVNTIYWVPSALCIIANWKAFNYAMPEYLNKVLFAGEVMPVKQLNYWISKLPDAMFSNLFGPTETTDICTYYTVKRSFSDEETLPIGKHCDNCDVMVIKDDGTEAQTDEEGELYARGSFLAMGYYNNPQKTAEVFVQNPLNASYPEMVYKTGDLVKYNDLGELIYISRKDFQIKHMGYRIEPGEIEAAANAIDGVNSAVVIYDSKEDKIILIYQGKIKDNAIVNNFLKDKLPVYMMPQYYLRVSTIPHNQNGKIDRVYLIKNYKLMSKKGE